MVQTIVMVLVDRPYGTLISYKTWTIDERKKIPKSSLHQKWAVWLLPSLTYKGLQRPNKK